MAVTRWALLCGGDFYLPPTNEQRGRPRNLSGCVRDVHAMRQVLLDAGISTTNIKMLTASCGRNNDGPLERREDWPTRANIKRELDDIRKNSSRGDLLYFHFSGHGGLRGEVEAQDANEADSFEGIKSGTALFMTDVFRGGPYLTGHQLGKWLEIMVTEKALRVTVVFDSCHSGGAFRNDTTITNDVRTLVGPPVRDVDRVADLECDSEEPGIIRDPSVRECWLSNPKNCTVLTACSSHQFAREKLFEGGQTHGAMTFWLLKLLTASNGRFPSHSRAVEYIQRQMNSTPPQTPLAFGDVLYEFFGHLYYSQGETCNAVISDSTRTDLEIELDIGRDQGVAVGARYNIFDVDRILHADQEQDPPLLRVKVSDVRASYCLAKPVTEVDVSALRSWGKDDIRHAVLDHWALAKSVSVHAPFLRGDKRDRLRKELEHTPRLRLNDDHHIDEFVDLTLRLSENNLFEILHQNELLHRLPKISIADGSWPTKLARVLSHVARYNELRRKYNAATLSHGLSRDDFDLTAKPDRVSHGEETLLQLQDRAKSSQDRLLDRDLWVSLYCFSDSWKITKVFPDTGKAALRDFFVHVKEGLVLTEDFPPKVNETDPDEVKDLFVFFVSKSKDGGGPPSWGDICLPRLELDKSCERMQYHAEGDSVRDPRLVIKVLPKSRNACWTTVNTLVYITPE